MVGHPGHHLALLCRAKSHHYVGATLLVIAECPIFFDVFSPAVYCSGYVSCKGEARTNKGNVLVNQENKYEEIGNTVFSLPFSPVQLAISMFCFLADGNLSGTLRYS